jgi:hypothetical protein
MDALPVLPRVRCCAVRCCAALRGAVTSLRHAVISAPRPSPQTHASSPAPTSISPSRQPPSPSPLPLPPVRQQCHGARAPGHGASHAATASKLQAIASVHFQRAPRTFTGWPAIPQTSTPGPWLLASRRVAFGLRPKRDRVSTSLASRSAGVQVPARSQSAPRAWQRTPCPSRGIAVAPRNSWSVALAAIVAPLAVAICTTCAASMAEAGRICVLISCRENSCTILISFSGATRVRWLKVSI